MEALRLCNSPSIQSRVARVGRPRDENHERTVVELLQRLDVHAFLLRIRRNAGVYWRIWYATVCLEHFCAACGSDASLEWDALCMQTCGAILLQPCNILSYKLFVVMSECNTTDSMSGTKIAQPQICK